MNSLLVVEREDAFEPFNQALRSAGHALIFEPDPTHALRRLKKCGDPVAILPISRLDDQAADLARALHDASPSTSILLLVPDAPPTPFVQALNGAVFDFLPFATQASHLLRNVRHAIERHDLLQTNATLRNRLVGIELSMQRSMEVSRALDHHLRRQDPPGIPGFAIGSLARPVDGQGGDFLGWFSLPEDCVGVYLGDAAGHDLASTAIRTYIEAEIDLLYARQAWDLLRNPAGLLSHLSRRLHPGRGVYASMVYLVVDQRSRNVFYSSAGHTPFICRTADARTDLYFSNSPLMGIHPEAVYLNHQVFLGHYTHMTLYSDGLVDGRFDREEPEHGFTTEQLKEFHRYATEDPEEFARLIYWQRMHLTAQKRESDDVSILVIRTGEPYTPMIIEEPLRAPAPRTNEIDELLGYSMEDVGAEVGFRPDQRIYFARIHGKADFSIANALYPMIEEAFRQELVATLVLDCLDIFSMDSTFLGMLQELNALSTAGNATFIISLADRKLMDNIHEMRLYEVIDHCQPAPYPWEEKLVPVERIRDLSSRGVCEHLLRAHQILASLGPENREKFAGVIEMLKKELGTRDEEPTDNGDRVL